MNLWNERTETRLERRDARSLRLREPRRPSGTSPGAQIITGSPGALQAATRNAKAIPRTHTSPRHTPTRWLSTTARRSVWTYPDGDRDHGSGTWQIAKEDGSLDAVGAGYTPVSYGDKIKLVNQYKIGKEEVGRYLDTFGHVGDTTPPSFGVRTSPSRRGLGHLADPKCRRHVVFRPCAQR